MHHLSAGLVMFGVPDAIEDRVAQPHVRRAACRSSRAGPRAIGKFACLHAREQVEIFFHGAIAKRTLLSEPAVLVRLFRRHVADVSFAFAHELLSVIRKTSIEIIGSEKRRAVAFQAEIFIRPAVDRAT